MLGHFDAPAIKLLSGTRNPLTPKISLEILLTVCHAEDLHIVKDSEVFYYYYYENTKFLQTKCHNSKKYLPKLK